MKVIKALMKAQYTKKSRKKRKEFCKEEFSVQ
jgi:hypothetical protein